MRALLPVIALLALSSCTSTPAAAQDQLQPVLEGRIRFFIIHNEGQPLELGLIYLEAESADEARASFTVNFYEGRGDLGRPRSARWAMALNADYCRDLPTWVEVVLTAPSGETWRSPRREVPAGPGWATSLGPVIGVSLFHDQPSLRTAVIQGGLFKLALENSQGERWQETIIDTLDPATRELQYDEELAVLRQTDPASYPIVREERVEYRGPPVLQPTIPAQPCPKA